MGDHCDDSPSNRFPIWLRITAVLLCHVSIGLFVGFFATIVLDFVDFAAYSMGLVEEIYDGYPPVWFVGIGTTVLCLPPLILLARVLAPHRGMGRRTYWYLVILLGIPSLFLPALPAAEAFARGRDFAQQASCNPRVVSWTCAKYAESHDGAFPPLSPAPGKLMYDWSAVSNDPISHAPTHACDFAHDRHGNRLDWDALREDPVNDWSYVYFGYAIENDAQALAFAAAYRSTVKGGGTFEQDIPVASGTGTCGTDQLMRLRTLETWPEEARCVADQAATIPVVIEWPQNHRHPGGKVVFLDEHFEYIPYPGKFPMTETFIGALRALDALAAGPVAVSGEEYR